MIAPGLQLLLHDLLWHDILTYFTSILCTKICMSTHSYPHLIPFLSIIAWFPVQFHYYTLMSCYSPPSPAHADWCIVLNFCISDVKVVRKRGRPAGSKNKSKLKKVINIFILSFSSAQLCVLWSGIDFTLLDPIRWSQLRCSLCSYWRVNICSPSCWRAVWWYTYNGVISIIRSC